MAIHVPVKEVVQPRHLAVFAFTDPAMTQPAKLDVYTGWIGVHFHAGGGSVQRDMAVSFVPVDKNLIQTYQEGDLLDVTVTATVSSVHDADDEANVEAVDQASVKLEPQGIAGSPLCLVLRARLGALNAIVHGITYQVTVLTRFRERREERLDLNPNDKPA